MNLHRGDLFWHTTRTAADYLEIQEDESCDCLIIGGGMSGALISYGLVEGGFNTIVIDEKIPGAGSSGGNTGMIQFTSDMSLDEMIDAFGEQRAVDFYKFSVEAMTEFKRIAGSFGDVGFKETKSLFLCSKESDLAAVKKNQEILDKYGFPARWIDKNTLKEQYALNAFGAIETEGDAEINPFKLIQSIHRYNLKNNARVYKNATFETIEEDEAGYIVKVNGYLIRAKNLIYATGYAKAMVPEAEPYFIRNTTFSIVTQKIAKVWGHEEMVWDSGEPYIYFRVTEDNRIIAGGFDQPGTAFKSQAEIKEFGNKIYSQLKTYYSDLDTSIHKCWQSVFGESTDGLPVIGRFKAKENKYYCLGLGGNGTCYSVMGSLIIRAYLEGRIHPYAYTTDLESRKK